jgi:hypothetical protein
MPDLTALQWRQGRSQSRAIYARTGGEDWKADTLIGYLDTGELAAAACQAHNNAMTSNTAEMVVKILGVLRTFKFSGYGCDVVDEIIADSSLDLADDLAVHIAFALESADG